MHIAYLDESGTQKEARHFVVAGLAVFERETYFLARSLDQLQAKYFPSVSETIEFHASSLHAPRQYLVPPWDSLTDEQRKALNTEIYKVITDSYAKIFAIVMEKEMLATRGIDCYEHGFEQLVNRFDRMLQRIFRDRNEEQRGLLVIAESSYRENLEVLAKRIWSQGHKWGQIRNMADIPFFAPAKSTRLLQLADFVSNAVYSRYENSVARSFDTIVSKFDQESGVIHGLVHYCRDHDSCYCPYCAVRKLRPSVSPEETP